VDAPCIVISCDHVCMSAPSFCPHIFASASMSIFAPVFGAVLTPHMASSGSCCHSTRACDCLLSPKDRPGSWVMVTIDMLHTNMSRESAPALLDLANTGAAYQMLHPLLPSLLLTVTTVFQEGELPSEMVPKHNDDPYNDDEEEEQEQERAPKAAKLLKPIDSAGIRMPLKLTSSLTSECKYMQCVMPILDSDCVGHLRCCMPSIAWPVCCKCIPAYSALFVWCVFLICCLLCAIKHSHMPVLHFIKGTFAVSLLPLCAGTRNCFLVL
jgi:hypothetical protein